MDKKKKLLTIITILLFIIVLFLIFFVVRNYILKKNFEKDILSFSNMNSETTFKIDKIVFFSNCDAKNKNISKSNFTIEDLYQYTDIAIFIDGNSDEKTLKNTFKEVTLSNLNFITPPSIGQPNLYFKSINQFSKNNLPDDKYIINDNFSFDITSNDEADLSNPILYNNLANPITLTYVNNNIKSDFTITDTSSPITYDGSLLKTCNIPISSINCKLSFDILITNNLDEQFKCSVYINIPLENNDKSIYDGNITMEQKTNYKFYRYK